MWMLIFLKTEYIFLNGLQASFTIVVPFFATATMEREVFEGSVATANVDAKLLSGLQGMPHIVTVDLHTMQNQFFFHGCTLFFFSFVFFVFCFFYFEYFF